MKTLLSLSVLLTLAASGSAAGPVRVLYLGKAGTPATQGCHAAMEELGREAIWFDYATDPKFVTPEWIASFDTVLIEGDRASYPALAGVDAAKLLSANVAAAALEGAKPDSITALRNQLIATLPAARKKEWEAFVAQREAEKREANPNVANYEKRPEPVTFQHPFSVRGSMERTQTAPDLHLELFASEPDIEKPIALAWDERGRCWVAETSDYPHGVSSTGEGHDRIKICEDTNGDGKADKFTVFADKLNIPTSLVFTRGGLLVAQPPRFLFLKDTDGDDKADVREVLMEGWGIGDTHAQANSLHYGYDNWLYGCVGYSGFDGTVGGKRQKFGMGTYRFKPDGSALEFLHQFSNNSWGHSVNRAGDQFGGTANGAPIFYGGIPQSVCPPGAQYQTAKKINVEPKVHAITPNYRQVDVFGGYTAAAGSAFIESANLPPRLQGQAMVCEPTMKTISLMDVQPEGAGYVAKDGFNLVASSDEWMSPVFAEVGPDGAAWFADWQNFIIQHNPTPSVSRGGYAAKTGVGGAHENPLRDHSRGRIYRVVWNQAKKPAITRLDPANSAQLVDALGSDNQFWRLTAQRLLVDGRKLDAVPALKTRALDKSASIAVVHALWTLKGLGQLDEATHRAVLASTDPVARRNAVRALDADAAGAKLLFASGTVSDADLHTRLAAMVKLAELPTTPEIKTLVAGLARDPIVTGDEWLAEASRLLIRKHEAILFKEGPNLLPNPGFEVVGDKGLPEGWTRRDYGNPTGNAGAQWEVVSGKAHSGERALRCISRDQADTSLFADVKLKPNAEYHLSAWIKTHGFSGKARLNDHIGRSETKSNSKRESDWSEVDVTFRANAEGKASINVLHVGKGDSYFDDVKLTEMLPLTDPNAAIAGDAKRGEEIFFKHQVVACVLCHQLKGQGSTVGPALDGLASRATPEVIKESLLEPNKVLAKGYEALGASPMPPMGLVLKPQELEDVKAYLQTLK